MSRALSSHLMVDKSASNICAMYGVMQCEQRMRDVVSNHSTSSTKLTPQNGAAEMIGARATAGIQEQTIQQFGE